MIVIRLTQARRRTKREKYRSRQTVQIFSEMLSNKDTIWFAVPVRTSVAVHLGRGKIRPDLIPENFALTFSTHHGQITETTRNEAAQSNASARLASTSRSRPSILHVLKNRGHLANHSKGYYKCFSAVTAADGLRGQMESADSSERKWACVAVSNLIQNDPSTRRLLQGKNVVVALIARLTDNEEEVVIEAMGSLRCVHLGVASSFCALMRRAVICASMAVTTYARKCTIKISWCH